MGNKGYWKKNGKPLKKQAIRNREYHRQTRVGDTLYRRSLNGDVFHDLMRFVTAEDNILMAVRNLKSNGGKNTPGVDGVTYDQIAAMDEPELVEMVRKRLEYYIPLPGKRYYLPKPDSVEPRPITMLAATDKIVDQSIFQVMDPIAEAKFHKDSYGYRVDKSAEGAVQRFCQLANLYRLHYVVSVDIKGFFDNVHHRKLMRQLWTMGIRDRKLLSIIWAMLKRPVVMPDGSVEVPERGTPQGGVLSPLLANICLNELDWWISDQWETFPIPEGLGRSDSKRFARLRAKTRLKPMFIVRYADDFKIFTDSKENAEKILAAVKAWLGERLRLEVSPGKTGITNLRKRSVDFLGFRFKLRKKAGKWVIYSRMSPKRVKAETRRLKEQIIRIQHAKSIEDQIAELNRYNEMVMGIHLYYRIATDISNDLGKIHRAIRLVWYNRILKYERNPKEGKLDPNSPIAKMYGSSKQIRYLHGVAIAPIGFCKTKPPMNRNKSLSRYTPEGRARIHRNLLIPMRELFKLMEKPAQPGQTVEFINNRISRYCGQYGKCAVTGVELKAEEMHCHHVIPKHIRGPDDSYDNLRLVTEKVHILIHATKEVTIMNYIGVIKDANQLRKLNKLRISAGNYPLNNVFEGGLQLSFFDQF